MLPVPGFRVHALRACPGMTVETCFSLKKPDPTGKERPARPPWGLRRGQHDFRPFWAIGPRMFGNKFRSKLADPDSAHALVYRLLTEQAFGQWKRYAIAFALMGVGASATALCAYLIGDVINAAYVHRNLPAIFWLALLTAAIFLVKSLAGLRSCGDAVADRQPHHRAQPAAHVRRADRTEPRVLLRAAFLGVHGAADHRCRGGEHGDQSHGHRDRPRSAFADRPCRGDVLPRPGHVV